MRFTIPRDIYFGRGSLAALKELRGKKAVIVTGGQSMERFGFLGQARRHLEEAGMEIAVYEGVEPDPSLTTVKRGAEFMEKERPDWIVALGGGSTIDAAKAMWIFYEYPQTDFEKIKEPFSLPELRQKARFAAVPSTSGTAAEVTAFSVITDETTGIKYPLADYNIVPDVAVLDAELADRMPAELAAHTGMDALTHAVEAYVARNASDFTDPLALQAIRMVFHNVVKSYEGDKEARTKMHDAQCLAGMAFTNALLGITHSIAHKTGHIFGLPHGLANAIYLPYVIAFNAEDARAREKYAQIARAVGVEEKDEEKLVDKLVEFIQAMSDAMKIPQSLKEYGVPEDEFRLRVDEIAAEAAADPCTSSNPRLADKEDIKKLLHCIYEGKAVKF
ncbi:iron-containing alcohol dehydrogenase [Bacilliculturomica massiliensis]|uniref:iron-containing alcohol dehydrogenase n=1 Tax=Bacilliculturomica massiliensis TaxID=1917867 RepID=UPI0010316CE4|nr:iron-containing alcohol dehydrogenase [Bacilliculturomica massiliensis]